MTENPYESILQQRIKEGKENEPDFFNKEGRKEGAVSVSGTPLAEGDKKCESSDIIDALKTVYDPELPVNIYDLGLIYSMEQFANGDVEVGMTLTAPTCPVAGEIPKWVADAVEKVDGVGVVSVRLTWTPKWKKEFMSGEAKLAFIDLF